MNPTRETKLEDLEAVQRNRAHQSTLSPPERYREKLNDLRAFVLHLARSENGRNELARRVSLLGPCVPADGESDRNYYGKLRRWLDHDV